MKKLFISLLTFLGLSISFSSASGLPTRYDLEYNLCNYSYNTTLNQIISQDFYTILGYALNNPICYHIMYYDPANLYSFRSYGNSMLEYRSNNSIFDFGNCASTFSDLMNRYDLSLSNGDQQMCNQIYNGNLQMYVSFYFPYNAQDCSSIQSDYDSCKSSLNTLSGSLATCNSNLSTCQSDLSSCQSQSCPSTGEILSGYILESSITSNYCEVEFGLIDPENCPASGGTGDVNWSSFFVNSHQVQGAENIYLFLPDFLNWDYTYIDSGTTLNIEVENEGDTEYIQSVIDINSYRPTSEDFTDVFVSGLTLVMPYIVIVLFIIFVRKLIKKIFK